MTAAPDDRSRPRRAPRRGPRTGLSLLVAVLAAVLVTACGAVVAGVPRAADGSARTAGAVSTGERTTSTRPAASTAPTGRSTPVRPATSRSATSRPTAVRPSTSRPTTSAPGTARPTAAPPRSTASRSTASRSTASRSTASRSAGPRPDPETGKVYALADHPILQDRRAGLANHVCPLPVLRATDRSLQSFYLVATRCLNRSWGEFLRAYRLPFTPPEIVFPTGSRFDTACGVQTVGIALAAYYCEGVLYLPPAGQQLDVYGADPGVYLALIAHEYGHHVQEVAGIMDASWSRVRELGESTPAGQQLRRRTELQAQCFSGLFVGSAVAAGSGVTRAMYARAWADQETRGDDTSGTTDHGSNAHYAQWWRAGALDDRIADCNTFAAPAAAVS